jgi:hypothetical protein
LLIFASPSSLQPARPTSLADHAKGTLEQLNSRRLLNGDSVERAVQLPVAATVEAVAVKAA